MGIKLTDSEKREFLERLRMKRAFETELKKRDADIAYLSMMTGVNLDQTEQEETENAGTDTAQPEV